MHTHLPDITFMDIVSILPHPRMDGTTNVGNHDQFPASYARFTVARCTKDQVVSRRIMLVCISHVGRRMGKQRNLGIESMAILRHATSGTVCHHRHGKLQEISPNHGAKKEKPRPGSGNIL
jgi:hypothetical protein